MNQMLVIRRDTFQDEEQVGTDILGVARHELDAVAFMRSAIAEVVDEMGGTKESVPVDDMPRWVGHPVLQCRLGKPGTCVLVHDQDLTYVYYAEWLPIRPTTYADVSWTVEDVVSFARGLNTKLSPGTAEELLDDWHKHIAEAMVSTGYEVLQTAIEELPAKRKLQKKRARHEKILANMDKIADAAFKFGYGLVSEILPDKAVVAVKQPPKKPKKEKRKN